MSLLWGRAKEKSSIIYNSQLERGAGRGHQGWPVMALSLWLWTIWPKSRRGGKARDRARPLGKAAGTAPILQQTDQNHQTTPQRESLRALWEKARCLGVRICQSVSLVLQAELAMIFPVAEQHSESMKKRILITACRHAILITERGSELGIPLDIDGEERMITDIEIRGGRWYTKDHRLTRGQQEKLAQQAWGFIENDQQPRGAPKISIRDCQKAIWIAGGIRISLRGKERLITEVKTGGAGNSRWSVGAFGLLPKSRNFLPVWREPSSKRAARQRDNYRSRTWSKKQNLAQGSGNGYE